MITYLETGCRDCHTRTGQTDAQRAHTDTHTREKRVSDFGVRVLTSRCCKHARGGFGDLAGELSRRRKREGSNRRSKMKGFGSFE